MEVILTDRPEERQRLTAALEEFARQHAVPRKALQAADLALEEHLTNVLSHGFKQLGSHEVVIRLAVEGPWLQIQIEDDGRPFNPLAQPKVDTSIPLADKPIGGLGIHLMRQFMDELDYRRSGEKNVLTMRKKFDTL